MSEEEEIKNVQNKEEPVSCSPLQIDFLQAVSQQLIQAQVLQSIYLLAHTTKINYHILFYINVTVLLLGYRRGLQQDLLLS